MIQLLKFTGGLIACIVFCMLIITGLDMFLARNGCFISGFDNTLRIPIVSCK